jgi:hypothetical protein
MKRLLIPLLVVFTVGCAEIPRDPYWAAEGAFQTLHAIDVLQTINGPVNDPCFQEGGFLTQNIIGEKPDTGEVLAWGVAIGAGHYAVSKLLDHYDAKPWMKATWQSVSIGHKGYVVANNHRIGVRPWGDNVSDCNLGG